MRYRFVALNDPYDHPILLHTHAAAETKTPVLTPLLGFAPIDGLSLQVEAPAQVNADVRRWRQRSLEAGHRWLISMDEIGPWHTGAAPDSIDPHHDALRGDVLWASLLGGAAGVEWYFGAHQPGNDLSASNWRDYDALWTQTRVALEILAPFNLARWAPCNARVSDGQYCLGRLDEALVIYAAAGRPVDIDLSDTKLDYVPEWRDAKTGRRLAADGQAVIPGAGRRTVQRPENGASDQVLILRRTR